MEYINTNVCLLFNYDDFDLHDLRTNFLRLWTRKIHGVMNCFSTQASYMARDSKLVSP